MPTLAYSMRRPASHTAPQEGTNLAVGSTHRLEDASYRLCSGRWITGTCHSEAAALLYVIIKEKTAALLHVIIEETNTRKQVRLKQVTFPWSKARNWDMRLKFARQMTKTAFRSCAAGTAVRQRYPMIETFIRVQDVEKAKRAMT